MNTLDVCHPHPSAVKTLATSFACKKTTATPPKTAHSHLQPTLPSSPPRFIPCLLLSLRS